MLEPLSFWRAQCSEATLEGFEQELKPLCNSSLGQACLHHRYDNSYHRALANKTVFSSAVTTRKRAGVHWVHSSDNITLLISSLANQTGWLEDPLRDEDAETVAILIKRGILFKHGNRLCLPAEFLITRRNNDAPNSWLTLVTKATMPLLLQLVPAPVQQTMTQPKPTKNELATWLAIHGIHARETEAMQAIQDDDWRLLYALQHRPIEDFNSLKQHFPDLPCITVTVNSHYYIEREEINLRKSLEANLPQQLRKLCLLGLIGIDTSGNNPRYACLSLTTEAKTLLAPHWDKLRADLANTIRQQWLAQPCAAERPSPWSNDHLMWRLWVASHFFPMAYTQQNTLAKNTLKKLAKTLVIDDIEHLKFHVISLYINGLLAKNNMLLVPQKINWNAWGSRQFKQMDSMLFPCDDLEKIEQKAVFALLAELPTECWLDANCLIQWLQIQATGTLLQADWSELFTKSPATALHDINIAHQRIYLHPQFHELVRGDTVQFPAPGWRGAAQKAKVHGFISPSGEIQLPPDCSHTILPKLAEFCTLTSVEQMITLQIDPKAFNREPTTLKKLRAVLESIQKPLPQAINYQFDKQKSRKPIAHVAATSMVLLLEDGGSIAKLSAAGFALSQPFPDHPEIVLLDASTDAYAFIISCKEAGIMLDTVIKPKVWVSGQVTIGAWMQQDVRRKGNWIEVCYQKTRTSKSKQIIARIDSDYYSMMKLVPTRKTKAGYTLLKQIVTLQTKHIMKLRELENEEVHELDLDKL
ncbi:MAG: hypothetical protein Q9M26_05110 [Mariprofundales bacterium]|nr:hypothetical protein [Mariprofundales bacterium]